MSLGLLPIEVGPTEVGTAEVGKPPTGCGGPPLGLFGEGMVEWRLLGVEGGRVGEGGMDAPKCLVSFMCVVKS